MISLGPANALRPADGTGFSLIFSSPILNQLPANTQITAERVGVRYFEVASHTGAWTNQLTPQALYDQIRARGGTPLYIEVWENPPSLGFIGNDDFWFIALYGGV